MVAQRITYVTKNSPDLMDFLASDERNLYVNINACQNSLKKFITLQQLTRRIIKIEDGVHPKTEVHIKLAHLFYGYILSSAASILRGHYDQSLSNVRIALEAAASSYVMHIKPDSVQDYYSQSGIFKSVFAEIGRNKGLYPLALPLSAFHKYASKRGSHSDHDIFEHRAEHKRAEPGSKFTHYVNIGYHDISSNSDEIEKQFCKNMYYLAVALRLFHEKLPLKNSSKNPQYKVSDGGIFLPENADANEWMDVLNNLKVELEVFQISYVRPYSR